jgi:hypothetical protein
MESTTTCRAGKHQTHGLGLNTELGSFPDGIQSWSFQAVPCDTVGTQVEHALQESWELERFICWQQATGTLRIFFTSKTSRSKIQTDSHACATGWMPAPPLVFFWLKKKMCDPRHNLQKSHRKSSEIQWHTLFCGA